MSDVFRSASVQHLKKHGPAVFDYCYWLSDGVDSWSHYSVAGIFPWAIRGSITKLAFAILVPDHVAAVRPAAELAFPLVWTARGQKSDMILRNLSSLRSSLKAVLLGCNMWWKDTSLPTVKPVLNTCTVIYCTVPSSGRPGGGGGGSVWVRGDGSRADLRGSSWKNTPGRSLGKSVSDGVGFGSVDRDIEAAVPEAEPGPEVLGDLGSTVQYTGIKNRVCM